VRGVAAGKNAHAYHTLEGRMAAVRLRARLQVEHDARRLDG